MAPIPPTELLRAYRDGRLVPFVGAGISMSVRWDDNGIARRGPSWTELVDQAARMLGFTEPGLLRVRGRDLQILEYFALKHHGRFDSLVTWLTRAMNPPDDVLRASPMHAALARLERCGLVYTTNFDDFLERSFELHGRPVRVVAVEEDMGRRDGMCEIVKFHGDWNHTDRMVVSESDYERRLNFNTPMDLRLLADVLGRVVLFLGYSFTDSNVAYLFRRVNEQLGELRTSSTGRRAYILVTDPSDFEVTLFEQRNIGVIALDGSRRTEEIAEFLSALAS